MAKKKSKFYVVWKGQKPGIYDSWDGCSRQVQAFPGARYRSYESRAEAEQAFREGPPPPGSGSKSAGKTSSQARNVGRPIMNSISVDAACSGNPGLMEYRGVLTNDKTEIFHNGPFPDGTNNIGEFLAIVHALAMLKKTGKNYPIYSDSRNAMLWVQKKKAKTTLVRTPRNGAIFDLIERAEKWLKENDYSGYTILKWETKAWGEIPADFGRK